MLNDVPDALKTQIVADARAIYHLLKENKDYAATAVSLSAVFALIADDAKNAGKPIHNIALLGPCIQACPVDGLRDMMSTVKDN